MNRTPVLRRLSAAALVATSLLTVAPAASAQLSQTGSEPVTATLATSTSLSSGTYLAQSGDTWEYIAPRLGVELGDLLRANGASASSSIRAGQAVVIPAVSKHPAATERTGTPYSGPMAASSNGSKTTVVGDSIALGSAALTNLELPGITIDAKEGRTFGQGLVRLAEMKKAGQLGDIVVMGMGVNPWGATSDQVRQALDTIGSNRTLVLVTASGPVSWESSTNKAMKNLAAAYPSRVVVADWEAASAYATDFQPDKIHPRAQGASIYARNLRLAVDEAAAKTAVETPKPAPSKPAPAPTPSKPAPAPTTGTSTVTVRSGDNLSIIASRYKVPGGWSAIASLNKLSSPYTIYTGQVLKLPTSSSSGTTTPGTKAPSSGTYTVKAGQGWWHVSRDTGVPMKTLLSANKATLSTVIHPGQKLKLSVSSTSTGSTGSKTYTVKAGQGWWQVSQATGVSVSRLTSLNKATLATVIHPNQKLIIG